MKKATPKFILPLKRGESVCEAAWSNYTEADTEPTMAPFVLDDHYLKEFPKPNGVGSAFRVLRHKKTTHTFEPARFLPDDNEASKYVDAVLANAKSNKSNVRAVSTILDKLKELEDKKQWHDVAFVARRALATLSIKACQKDGEALCRFATLILELVDVLNGMAMANPRALQPVAAKKLRWPLMRSTHPLLGNSDNLLASLKLGSEVPFCADKYAKWKFDGAANVAFQLFRHLSGRRGENLLRITPDGALKQTSKRLPDFSKGTSELWWSVAKNILLRTYPKPEEVEELARLCTTPARLKSKGRIRERILTLIRDRFLHMAAYQS